MLFLFLSFIYSKTLRSTNTDFHKYLKMRPFTIALFTSTGCQPCRKIQSIMDSLSIQYRDAINFLFVDLNESPKVFQKYNIQYVPQVAVFRESTLIKFYRDAWNQFTFEKFITELVDANIQFINNSFSLFSFLNQEPANLLLTTNLTDKGDAVFMKYGGAFNIGILEDDSLAKELKLPPALFTLPHGEMELPITDFDEYDLANLSRSPFDHIHNQEFAGTSPTQFIFMALVDENDPLHMNDAIIRMKTAFSVFGHNITYQYCDFFTCTHLVERLGLINFMNPCYVIYKREGMNQHRLEPFRKLSNTPDDVLAWLKYEILGIEMPKEKVEIQIPRLYADEFIPKALDPSIDAILLVAATGMQLYDESVENFRKLMILFKDIPTVKFWEFNRFTEHVQGLEIPKSDKPLLSVWPATKPPRGSSFGGYLSLQLTFESLLKLINTQIPQEKLEEMTQVLAKLMHQSSSEYLQ